MNRVRIVLILVVYSVLAGCPTAPADQSVDSAKRGMQTGGGSASTSTSASFPEEWFYSNRPATLRAMEGKPAPALKVKNWIGEAQLIDALKGKVVVVDFWATWCPPCIRSLPHNVRMVNDLGKEGLVFIGVHESNRGSDRMATVATANKLNYPLAVDDNNQSVGAYRVGFFPTYFVIDRSGTIRGAGLNPTYVEAAVKQLLAEK